MLKLSVVVGARPQFIKAAALYHAWKKDFQSFLRWELIHTGQHYDEAMSGRFFEELALPQPNHSLQVQGLGPVETVAAMSTGLSQYYSEKRPNLVLVFGDTHSTLSAALTAAGLGIPLAHVEAGLRSFRRDMPEEQARVVTDHLSTWLFAPSDLAMQQIQREGLMEKPGSVVQNVGDIMLDAALLFSENPSHQASDGPILATLHRNFNTDHPERLAAALQRMHESSIRLQREVCFVAHPRTQKAMNQWNIHVGEGIFVSPPMGYLETLQAIQRAPLVLTDSGGLQKEAFFLGKRSICFRPESEWTELVQSGWVLCPDLDKKVWEKALEDVMASPDLPRLPWYGEGKAGWKILSTLVGA